MENKYIICDIDGVLIDSSWIWAFVNQYPIKEKNKIWDFFNKNCNAAINGIDNICAKFVKDWASERNCRIYFLTARHESTMLETRDTLQRRLGFDVAKCDFCFRKDSDNESSVISKENRLKALLALGYEFDMAIDDDRNICEMYSKHGINNVYNWQFGSIPTKLVREYMLNGKLENLLRV